MDQPKNTRRSALPVELARPRGVTIPNRQWLTVADYKKIIALTPVCTVDILCFNRARTHVLLGRRTNKPLKGQYFSPGGRLLKNELFVEGAVRQAKRELGLTIRKKNLVFGGVQNEIHRESIYPGINYHCVDVFFGYVLTNAKIRLDGQHSEVRWVRVNNRTLHHLIKNKINALLQRYD